MTYICAYFIAFYIVYSVIDIIVNAEVLNEDFSK